MNKVATDLLYNPPFFLSSLFIQQSLFWSRCYWEDKNPSNSGLVGTV